MKNALTYYYNINPTSIHQINKNYRCYLDNEEYLLMVYEKENYDINNLYELSNELLQVGIPCHQIVLNINGDKITTINNLPYVLLKVFVSNRSVNIFDIVYFSRIIIDATKFQTLVRNNWHDMWTKKIDYFEYQVSQLGKKYPIIRESINYYIGLAENSISLFLNYAAVGNNELTISHKRIKTNQGLIDLYNPLNFILDNRVRDFGEYVKAKFFFELYTINEFTSDIVRFNLTENLYGLLYVRLLFPSYYFDCYEDVMFDLKDERELIKIIEKNDAYLSFLKDVYFYLSQLATIPEIDWIIKT